jgi:hypothetical protein
VQPGAERHGGPTAGAAHPARRQRPIALQYHLRHAMGWARRHAAAGSKLLGWRRLQGCHHGRTDPVGACQIREQRPRAAMSGRCYWRRTPRQRTTDAAATRSSGRVHTPGMPAALNTNRTVPRPARHLLHRSGCIGVWGLHGTSQTASWHGYQAHGSRPHAERLPRCCTVPGQLASRGLTHPVRSWAHPTSRFEFSCHHTLQSALSGSRHHPFWHQTTVSSNAPTKSCTLLKLLKCSP